MADDPPFILTDHHVDLISQISEAFGVWRASQTTALTPQLRRENRIRTIQASLAIEQNTLSVEQVSAILEGMLVSGTPREIQEVRNAISAYDEMTSWNPCLEKDFLSAHKILMRGLVDEAGKFRNGGVGIYKGEDLIHMAPPADRVPAGSLSPWPHRNHTDASWAPSVWVR